MPHGLSVPSGVVLLAVLITAATDLRGFKVHNVLTLPLLASGVLYHGIVGGAPGLVASVLGLLFGFGALAVGYALGGMGGGDVKLLAGVGAWLGLPLTFSVLIVSSLAAGVFAVSVIALYGSAGESWANLRSLGRHVSDLRRPGGDERVETAVGRADRRGRLVPFAPMIAVGVVVTFLLAWLGELPC